MRRHYFYPPTRVTQYYENTVAKVRAEAQVRIGTMVYAMTHLMRFDALPCTPYWPAEAVVV